MNTCAPPVHPAPVLSRNRGVTLIELSIVILVLLALAGIGLYVGGGYNTWNKERQAIEKLRTVYSAQRGYLADHPTTAVSALTPEMIIPYLATGEEDLPPVEGLDGSTQTIQVDVMPPVVPNGAGGEWTVGDL